MLNFKMRQTTYLLCQALVIIYFTNVRAIRQRDNDVYRQVLDGQRREEAKHREIQNRLPSDKFCGKITIETDDYNATTIKLKPEDELFSIVGNDTRNRWLKHALSWRAVTRDEYCKFRTCGSKLIINADSRTCEMIENINAGGYALEQTLQAATSITCLCRDSKCRAVPCASVQLDPEECARLYKESDCNECYIPADKMPRILQNFKNYSLYISKGSEVVSAVVNEGCEIWVEEFSQDTNALLQILRPGIHTLTKIEQSMEVTFKVWSIVRSKPVTTTGIPGESTLRPRDVNDNHSLTVQIATGVTASVVVVVLMTVGIYLAWKKFSTFERKLHEQRIPGIDLDEFFNGKQLVPKSMGNSEQESQYVTFDLLSSGNNSSTRPAEIHQQTIDFALSQPYQWKWEIPKKQIKKSSKILGKGEFGEVFVGDLQREGTDKTTESVAIKEGRDHLIKSLLIEIKILSFIGKHTNVVNMLGASVSDLRKRKSSSAWLVLELCSNGSMKSFLNNHRLNFDKTDEEPIMSSDWTKVDEVSFDEVLSIRNLYKWSHEIALGMEFLETMKILHIDLAARNVLLDSNCVAKIGDFGSSRKLYSNMEYWKHLNQDGTMDDALAYKWMALESLQKLVFSAKSEVWSYGVTIWEIFTLGRDPYFQVNNYDQLASSLLHGMRLPQPSNAEDHIYEIMKRCWEVEPDSRPTFTELQFLFKEQFEFEELSERL